MMKLILSFVILLVWSSSVYSQSGRRRPAEIKTPVPPPAEAKEIEPKPAPTDQARQVTAEKNEDYGCTDDGSLGRILDTGTGDERMFTSKQVDIRVIIISKPQPSYTKEARRNRIQGFVSLKVLLSANGQVSRIRIVKGLPAGLTESAIRAACKIKFKPAMKDGENVSQWVIAEYIFRLVDSSIFGP
ncbi:MAG: energy transducer TonB [Acidobacteriota bacterium]|nr:energy transducer TonB [Acidobacteriota bacterium]